MYSHAAVVSSSCSDLVHAYFMPLVKQAHKGKRSRIFHDFTDMSLELYPAGTSMHIHNFSYAYTLNVKLLFGLYLKWNPGL